MRATSNRLLLVSAGALSLLVASAACGHTTAAPGTGGNTTGSGSGNATGTTGTTGTEAGSSTVGSAGTAGTGGSSPGGASGGAGGAGAATDPTHPDFGPNVLIFDPSMATATIQSQIDVVFQTQQTNQFGDQRYAYLFKPGQYALDVQVGFYMTVLGLGASPDDVTITGAVRSKATWFQGNATQNFWRYAENLAVVPTEDSSVEVWAVSQATGLRRFHVKGQLDLWDGGWSSGGFIADSLIDTQVLSGSQQQFLTRNTVLTSWVGGAWNMVFVGDENPPSGTWPVSPYTVVATTPTVREKPYLVIDGAGAYSVVVPSLRTSSQGISWGATPVPATTVSLAAFYLAHPDTDTADTLNGALAAGRHLLLTPGVYHLASSLQVTRAGAIVLGLGVATLHPDQGTPAIVVADVDGVSVGGILFDAGATSSPTLLQIGAASSSQSHATSPTALFDLSCRVGGEAVGNTASCFTINSSDVLLDNVWLWRADHGTGVGWTTNVAQNGITVNGDNVSAYGLFVEHFEQYQTLWNGNGGRVYFYQSEIPYDVPDQGSWTHGGENGYASYKVASSVTSHDARGLGVYSVFDNPVTEENAVETPTASGVTMQHLVTEYLGSTAGGAIEHILNGAGGTVDVGTMQADSAN